MTFAFLGRTLPIVVYSQFRTLISLLIVIFTAGLFMWGGSKLLNSVTGAAPPPPTATVPAAIEQPATPTLPAVTATARAFQRAHPSPTATPRPTATPSPTPTPKGPPKVFTTTSLDTSTQSTKFPTGIARIYCWVRNVALSPGTASATFWWYADQPPQLLNQFALTRQGGDNTIAWFPFAAQPQGKYHCEVTANGQVVGDAHFTIGP